MLEHATGLQCQSYQYIVGGRATGLNFRYDILLERAAGKSVLAILQTTGTGQWPVSIRHRNHLVYFDWSRSATLNKIKLITKNYSFGNLN